MSKAENVQENCLKTLNLTMFVSKIVVCCSMLINLSLVAIKGTPKPPWNYKRGGINVTWNDELIRQLIEEKKGIARKFEYSEVSKHLNLLKHKKQKIPEFFDVRMKWPMCRSVFRIKDQGPCSTCWAFVSAGLTSDRLCIASKGRLQVDISEQDIVTCCKECYQIQSSSRCETAAEFFDPLMYMIKYGVVLANCQPYNSNIIEEGCKQSCVEKTMFYNRLSINNSFIVMGEDVADDSPTTTLEDAQIEIMKYGPLGARLNIIPVDLVMNYTREVYIETNSDVYYDGHAVKIIGWGTENGLPYWLCASSWGTTWGKLGGFFKIKRGSNLLGIEDLFIAIDTDPENRPKVASHTGENSASAMSFTEIVQNNYKITIIVVVIAVNL